MVDLMCLSKQEGESVFMDGSVMAQRLYTANVNSIRIPARGLKEIFVPFPQKYWYAGSCTYLLLSKHQRAAYCYSWLFVITNANNRI